MQTAVVRSVLVEPNLAGTIAKVVGSQKKPVFAEGANTEIEAQRTIFQTGKSSLGATLEKSIDRDAPRNICYDFECSEVSGGVASETVAAAVACVALIRTILAG